MTAIAKGVTVVIPVYNRAKIVLDALDSVAVQTLCPERLIIVDDGSDDDITEQFSLWREHKKPRFFTELLRQQQGGAGSARNAGLKQAPDSVWIAFLDSDDLWAPDFLERAVTALETSPAAIGAVCDRLSEDHVSGTVKLTSTQGFPEDPRLWCLEGNPALLSGMLFRADAVREVDGFDTQLKTGQDLKLFLDLGVPGRFVHLPGEPFRYRTGLGASGQLHEAFSDSQERWSRIFETFLCSNSSESLRSDSRYRKAMSTRWKHTATQHLSHDRIRKAEESLRSSLRWKFGFGIILHLALIRIRMLYRN